ncbi:MAG TPA: hypothetical protein VMO75_02100 [Chthoniobacterales bacterium]|nr:hypothetical protein [Chthoniobacterales bacterium]
MNSFFVILTALVTVTTSVQARLGETLDECKMRYGQSAQLAPDQFKFNRSQIIIIVRIRNGRSIQEDFAPEGGSALSEGDVAQLLQENSEGSSFEVSGETATYTTYIRKDGKASAQRAKPNASGSGNVKLSIQGAELIIKYSAEAIAALPPAQ